MRDVSRVPNPAITTTASQKMARPVEPKAPLTASMRPAEALRCALRRLLDIVFAEEAPHGMDSNDLPDFFGQVVRQAQCLRRQNRRLPHKREYDGIPYAEIFAKVPVVLLHRIIREEQPDVGDHLRLWQLRSGQHSDYGKRCNTAPWMGRNTTVETGRPGVDGAVLVHFENREKDVRIRCVAKIPGI